MKGLEVLSTCKCWEMSRFMICLLTFRYTVLTLSDIYEYDIEMNILFI